MTTRGALITGIVCGMLIARMGIAWAGVAVEEDEVIFTLVAPDAQAVFLVGDFNNWNPTLEKMQAVGDRFEIRLFLLPGRYRYKFVVDGNWINDPDNPATDPKAGSGIVLEARGDVLVIGDEPVAEGVERPRLRPSARYRGAFVLDEGDGSSDQAFDLYMTYESDGLRTMANFKSTEASGDRRDGELDVDVNRGFIELRRGKLVLRGIENDTIWTSTDPFHLVGDVGVFGYNAGYDRRGFTGELSRVLDTTVRVLYADHGSAPALGAAIPRSAFTPFGASISPDTTIYRFSPGLGDADTWALEVFADAGSVEFGYGTRRDRGLHPGLVAEVRRQGIAFERRVSATRTDWAARVLWARWKAWRGVHVEAALATAEADVHVVRESVSIDSSLGDVIRAEPLAAADRRLRWQKSRRWYGGISRAWQPVTAQIAYERNRFDFEPLLNNSSRATMHVASLEVDVQRPRWRATLRGRYSDQDYGDAPADFHFLTPTRNLWLDGRDRLDVPDMVTFDLDRFSHLGLRIDWGERGSVNRIGVSPPQSLALWLHLQMTGRKVFDTIEYVAAQTGAEARLYGHFYGVADLRLARYDHGSGNVEGTFFNAYVEVAYRRARYEISAGLGLDPLVLDPVTNDYNDIGRIEALRRSRPADLTRGRADELADRLHAEEAALEDLQSRLKLEVVFLF